MSGPNRCLGAALVLAAALGSSAAWAQPQRIAVVNMSMLHEEAPQAKRAGELLEREFGERQRALLQEQRALNQMQERGDRAEAGEVATRLQALQQRAREYEEALSWRREEEQRRFARMVADEIKLFATEEGIDLVLVDGYVFSSGRTDVTDRILQRLRAKSEGG